MAALADGAGANAAPNAVAVAQVFAPEVLPNRYIVVLKDPVDALATARDVALQYGVRFDAVYSHALRGFVATIPAGILDAMRADPRVAYVAQDRVVYALGQTLPTGVDRIEADRNTTARIDGVDDRVGADIAILDTGIDLTHPDLNVVEGVSFVSTEPSANDLNGHGTHVAGIAAALDNGIGVVGMAPGARLHAVKVLDQNGSGSVSQVIAGVDWVTAHASVIDVAGMSLGGIAANADDGNCGYTNNDPLHTAICKSVGAGVTYVVAAGNSRIDAKDFFPAAYDEVLTVSAIADDDGTPIGDLQATFTNFGADIDFAAPGRSILSTFKGGTYATLSGTSMSTPHVTGAAALYKALVPIATPAQVRAALLASAEPAPPGGWRGDPDGIPEPLARVRDMTAGPVDAGRSLVIADPPTVEADGTSMTTVSVLPRDASGNILGPHQVVAFSTTAGTLVGGIGNDGNDLYTQDLQSGTVVGSSASVTATVNGVAITLQPVVPFTLDLLNKENFPITRAPYQQRIGAAGSNGVGYLTTWWTRNPTDSYYKVWAARVTLDGSLVDKSPILLDQAYPQNQFTNMPPKPAVGSDGANYLVVWPKATMVFNPMDIYGAILRPSDGTIVKTLKIANSMSKYGPSIAFDGTKYLVTWYQWNTKTIVWDVYGSRVRTDGSLIDRNGFAIVKGATPSVYLGDSTTTAYDGKNFIVAWSRITLAPCPGYPSTPCPVTDSDVTAARVTPAGTVLDPSGVTISSDGATPTYELLPSIAAKSGGASFIAWEQVPPDWSGPSFVLGSRLADGASLTVVDPTGIAFPGSHSGDPSVSFDGSTNYVVAWTDGTNPDDGDIMGARVRASDGLLLDPGGFVISHRPDLQFQPSLASSGTGLFALFQDANRVVPNGSGLTAQLLYVRP